MKNFSYKKQVLNILAKISFVIVILFSTSLQANSKLCSRDVSKSDCSKSLANYPLFDTAYKMHANYLPILALRALAHGEIYKEKKKFKLERFYYVKNTSGAFQDYYAKLVGEGKVEGHGFFGRKVSFKGFLNEFPLEYVNKMSFSLPKKAKMEVEALLDDNHFLELEIHSDADAMTNDVEGLLFGREVKYHTHHRDSSGILGGYEYSIHTEGKVKDEGNFLALTEGKIANYNISGTVNLTAPNKYLSIEHYGPIMVKTFITVL